LWCGDAVVVEVIVGNGGAVGVVVGGCSKIKTAKEKHDLKDHSPDHTNNSRETTVGKST